MQILKLVVQIVRLPVDLMLITCYYLYGVVGLARFTVKRLFKLESDDDHLLDGFRFCQKGALGTCRCQPGGNFQSGFIYRQLCPDLERERQDGEWYRIIDLSDTSAMSPAIVCRFVIVGFVIVLIWISIFAASYRFVTTAISGTGDKHQAGDFVDLGMNLLKRADSNDAALVAFNNAIKHDPDDAQAHLGRGLSLLKILKPTDAVRAFNTAVRLDPELWEAHLELARLAAANRHTRESAIRHAEAACKINSSLPEAHLILASSFYGQGKTTQVREQLDLAMALPIKVAEHYRLAAYLYHGVGKLAQAETYYRRALGLDLTSLETELGLAYIFIDQKRWDEAATWIDDVLGKAPHNVDALICRAEYYDYRGEFDRARDIYEDLLRQNPENHRIQTKFASLLIRTGDNNRGAAMLRQVVAARPGFVDARLLLAKSYLADRMPSLALDEVNTILKYDPGILPAYRIQANALIAQGHYAEAIPGLETLLQSASMELFDYVNLAKAYWKLGNAEMALKTYRDAGQRYPASSAIDINSADVLLKTGNVGAAILACRAAREKAPSDDLIANNLAVCLTESGNHDNIQEAIKIARELRQRRPQEFFIADTLGWALYRGGAYEEARQELSAAIQLNPRLPVAYYHLGKTMYKLDDLVHAQQSLQYYLKLSSDAAKAEEARELLVEIQKKTEN